MRWSPPSSTSGARPHRPQFDRPHRSCAAPPYGRRQSQRLRSEASFASLCGVSPVPASSGKTVRHRLNRGGDRAANSALHIIAIGRLRTDQRTKDYVARRTAEGHSKLDAIRALKRYLAREVYRSSRSGERKSTPPPNRRLTNRRASRAPLSPPRLSSASSRRPASRFRWTDVAASWTTFSSNGCGARSSMKKCI